MNLKGTVKCMMIMHIKPEHENHFQNIVDTLEPEDLFGVPVLNFDYVVEIEKEDIENDRGE